MICHALGGKMAKMKEGVFDVMNDRKSGSLTLLFTENHNSLSLIAEPSFLLRRKKKKGK